MPLPKVNENNIIVYEPSEEAFWEILRKAFTYALLSLPFTINRMAKRTIKSRILNIIKGKLAEHLFFLFLDEKNIPYDKSRVNTPFYQIDRGDFILKEYRWDIKNNFFHCERALHHLSLFLEFYGLIPDRNENDQWTKFIHFDGALKPAVLFTFMYELNLEIQLSEPVKRFLAEKYREYRGMPLNEHPHQYTR